MKVIDVDVIDAGKHTATILFLDEKMPPKWKQVKIDDQMYTPIFMSGAHDDKIALAGVHKTMQNSAS